MANMATAMWVEVFVYQELFSHFNLLALYDI